jgi:hypothetical protein
MKRFIGWLLTVVGVAATLWGGFAVLTGTAESRLTLTQDVSVNAMTEALVGLAALTVGLIWVRD